MNREEAKEIFIEIQRLYPLFNRERDKDLAKLWIDRLQLGDYQKSKHKLLDYSMESTYPPSLADVIVKEYKHRDDGMAEAIRESEEVVRKENEDPETLKHKRELIEEMRQKLHYMEGGR